MAKVCLKLGLQPELGKVTVSRSFMTAYSSRLLI